MTTRSWLRSQSKKELSDRVLRVLEDIYRKRTSGSQSDKTARNASFTRPQSSSFIGTNARWDVKQDAAMLLNFRRDESTLQVTWGLRTVLHTILCIINVREFSMASVSMSPSIPRCESHVSF